MMPVIATFAFCLVAVLPVVAQPASAKVGSLRDPTSQCWLGSPHPRTAPAGKNDENAVREMVRKYMEAREKQDASAIAALFTEDADQFTTGGQWRRGRDNVVRGGLASSARNPGARRITLEAVRFPAPGVAIADGRYEIGAGQDNTQRM